GDPSLFEAGRTIVETHTGRPCLGVVPHFEAANALPAEAVLALENAIPAQGDTVIAVPLLPRIAHFDLLHPLRADPGVRLVMLSEDVLALENSIPDQRDTVIAPPRLPRIANFDDLDPLRAEPGVRLVIVPPGQPLPRDARLVILPGSKSPRADLAFFREQGW